MFLGKPIIEYSISAARNAGIFDEVMVSTDDLEIAEIAQKLGAQVPFIRSVENSDDFSTTSDVLSEVISQYESRGEKFDYACCLIAEDPSLRSVEDWPAIEHPDRQGTARYNRQPNNSPSNRNDEIAYPLPHTCPTGLLRFQ